MMSSETTQAREVLSQFAIGLGIDIGFGGSSISPSAINFDLPEMYCPSFEGHRQHLRGDCRTMPFICDGAFDYVFSSHLIEDFTYNEQIDIIREWRRILQPHGVLIINAPDQQKFLAHCAATGQSINANHKEGDFSLHNFRDRVVAYTGEWQTIYEQESAGPYSWYLVLRKT